KEESAKTESDTSDENSKNSTLNEEKEQNTTETQTIKQNMSNQKSQNANMSSSKSMASSGGGSAQSSANNAVYNGSGNNYLSTLEIEGISLNTNFNKENTTYFITVQDKESLSINTVAEDENAKVYITGNSGLAKGDNKVLISVTAENGAVRHYRVFVKSE
ncbi:MAG: hypothetical protein IJR47_04745, partial [Clostridia bacterium]|nr:hypothetical protein [Clostridia bacterium]